MIVTRKKGVYIPPRVFPELSKEIETFDGIILIGNETTLHTYSEYNMPKTVLVDNSGYEKLVKEKYSFGNYEQNIKQALCELLGC